MNERKRECMEEGARQKEREKERINNIYFIDFVHYAFHCIFFTIACLTFIYIYMFECLITFVDLRLNIDCIVCMCVRAYMGECKCKHVVIEKRK